METAWNTLDFWGDGGELLARTVPFHELPEYVKTASHLGSGRSAEHDPAVIIVDRDGAHPLFPTVDPGNTALSAHYLLQNAGALPDDVVKVAAMNVAASCLGFGMGVPEDLLRLAGVVEADVRAVEPVVHVKEARAVPSLKTTDAGKVRLATGTGTGVTAGVNRPTPFTRAPQPKLQVKTASQHPTERLARCGTAHLLTEAVLRHRARTYEMDKKERAAAGRKKHASYEKVAADAGHFNRGWRAIHPLERVKLAQALVEPCFDLGIGLVPQAEVYARGVGDIGRTLRSISERRAMSDHPGYALLEKTASRLTAAEAVARLWELDEETGLSRWWNTRIEDPFLAVMVKLAAEEPALLEAGTARVAPHDIEELARNRRPMLERHFGESFADQFQKNPVRVFKSLPEPTREIIARMVKDGTELG